MKSSAKSINLTSLDDLFSTEESRAEESCEKVVRIPLAELHPFPNHPFHVRDDEAMQNTVDSIREYGVLTPGIVRPCEDGGYEIVAGHRRKHGSELAGLSDMPCIVREMDDDTATILMVDSNIQREDILPSERAQAYKMKMEALKRQGARSDLTSPQLAAKFRADDEVAKAAGVSGDTVRRFVRLTELQPELQQMVDDKKIAMTPAVELSCGAVCYGVYDVAVCCLQNAVCGSPHQHTLHDRASVPADTPRQRSFQQAPLPAPGKGDGYSCSIFNVCSVQFRQAGHYPPVHDPDRRVCADYRHTSRGTQKIL